MKDFLTFIGGFVIIVCLVICISYPTAKAVCNDKSVSFEAVDFRLFGGCMVLHKGKWYPIENILIAG